MEPDSPKWVGSPCGSHGPYIFYKAFKCSLGPAARIVSLGDFFFVRCQPEDPLCVAELQLLWEERTSGQLLSSSKLYFLPEDTPQGRTVNHGEDEIVGASEKVIVKLENLAKWMVSDCSGWKCGLRAVPLKAAVMKELGQNGQKEVLHRYRDSILNSGLNFKDVLKEKAEIGEDEERRKVLVLSYPQYCRYRAMLARLRERPSSLLADQVVLALGGIAALHSNMRIFYCRETFDHPTLVENESICDEFAPNLKGRPRKKKLSFSQRRDSQGSGSEGKSCCKVKQETKAVITKPKGSSSSKKGRCDEKVLVGLGEESQDGEQAFLVALYRYMKERKTPIERIPYLGFKQINLWTMFQAAQKLGGYELITARRQWKNVYDELGGNPGSTSAATCTRRHYERLILPYERYLKGEEDKPLPPAKPRKQENNIQEGPNKAKPAVTKRPKSEQKCKLEEDDAVMTESTLVVGSQEESPGASGLKLKSENMGEGQELQLSDEGSLNVHSEDAQTHHTLLCETNSEKGPSKEISNNSEEAILEKLSPEPQSRIPNGNCVASPQSLHLSRSQEQWPNGIPVYRIPCTDDMVCPSVRNEVPNHVGLVLPTLKPGDPAEIPTKNGELPMAEESSFSYGHVLYQRTNAGIMSPLAKKKLLSQVNKYPLGPPPPLISNNCIDKNNDQIIFTKDLPMPTNNALVINRPSVIQHAQSFKSQTPDERNHSYDVPDEDVIERSEAFTGNIPNHHQQSASLGDFMLSETHNKIEKPIALTPRTNFLSDFYSSHHMEGIYRQSNQHLSTEHLSRALFSQDCDNIQSFPASFRPNGVALDYGEEKEKLVSEEQPTDLSLPKTFSHQSPSSTSYNNIHQGTKNIFQMTNGLDYHPKACRVYPMTITSQKYSPDSQLRAAGNAQVEEMMGHKIEELVRPISNKRSPQNIGAARPLKRNPECVENGPTEKKVRAVTPMHSVKEAAESQDCELGAVKAIEPNLVNRYAESPKFASPIFPGFYHGTFFSQVQDACESLNPHLPAGYSHPLQYLKHQAVLSPLMPPFAIQSLMMQRQLLATAAHPSHLYRQPAGAPYSNILHHGLYPLSVLNSPSSFSPPHLSSVHPSTKLS